MTDISSNSREVWLNVSDITSGLVVSPESVLIYIYIYIERERERERERASICDLRERE